MDIHTILLNLLEPFSQETLTRRATSSSYANYRGVSGFVHASQATFPIPSISAARDRPIFDEDVFVAQSYNAASVTSRSHGSDPKHDLYLQFITTVRRKKDVVLSDV